MGFLVTLLVSRILVLRFVSYIVQVKQKGADVEAAGISKPYIVWTPDATTAPGQYVLKLQDSAGTIAYSNMFQMLAANSVSLATTAVL